MGNLWNSGSPIDGDPVHSLESKFLLAEGVPAEDGLAWSSHARGGTRNTLAGMIGTLAVHLLAVCVVAMSPQEFSSGLHGPPAFMVDLVSQGSTPEPEPDDRQESEEAAGASGGGPSEVAETGAVNDSDHKAPRVEELTALEEKTDATTPEQPEEPIASEQPNERTGREQPDEPKVPEAAPPDVPEPETPDSEVPEPEHPNPESPKVEPLKPEEHPKPEPLPEKAVELRRPEAPQPKKPSPKKKAPPAKVTQIPQQTVNNPSESKKTSESDSSALSISAKPGEPKLSDRPAGTPNSGDGATSGDLKAETGPHSKGLGLAGKEFQLAQVDKPPVVVSRVEPGYPLMARRRNINGQVTVKFLVDAQGRVQKPSIVRANPEGIFESSVLDAVARWRFKPGIYRGQAVSTWVILPIQFKLAG
jgi:protein TonB